MGREAAESLHRPDAAATAEAAAILIERSGCARLFPSGGRSRREAPRALIPPPPALSSPPALPPLRRTHAARSSPPRPARCPPFPLPSGLPALGPPPLRVRPPRPARISVSGRKGNAKPARSRGGVRVSRRRWRRHQAGRSCAASPTAAHSVGSRSPASAGSLAPPYLLTLSFTIFPVDPPTRMGAAFSHVFPPSRSGFGRCGAVLMEIRNGAAA